MEKDEDVQKDLIPDKNRLKPVITDASQINFSLKRISIPDFQRLPSFTQVDKNRDGSIDFDEFRSSIIQFLPDLPEEEVIRIFDEVDVDHDGVLDRVEYTTWKNKAIDFARALMLPKNVFEEQNNQRHLYKDLYSCTPPPIFMFSITLVEIAVFIYHWFILKDNGETLYNYGPPPIHSVLIYHPERRHEVWRYFTYVFIHSGYMHIINNVLVQLVLGVLLELVHKWWRVLIIYFAGVLAGSLATSVVDPYTYLAGASGGVYALIFAHLSTVILNWSEMEYPWVRVLLFSTFVTYDVGIAFYYEYYLGKDTIVGYPAHLGGGIAGLLTGFYVLKNVKWEKWETYLWYASVITIMALIIFAVSWNLFKEEYYPSVRY